MIELWKRHAILLKIGGGGTPRLAYTLAEVVIVMLVIAVIAGVSVKITKAKLDNITAYTYYMGYSTLRNVTGQMLGDFKSTDEDYTTLGFLDIVGKKLSFLNNFFSKPVEAKTVKYYSCDEEYFWDAYGGSNWADCGSDTEEVTKSEYKSLNDWFAYKSSLTYWTTDKSSLNCKSVCAATRSWYNYYPNPSASQCPGQRLVLRYKGATGPYVDGRDRSLLNTYAEPGRSTSDSCNYPCNNGNNNCGYFSEVEHICIKWYKNYGSVYEDGYCVTYVDDGTPDDTPTENVCSNQPSEATIRTEYCQNQREWEGYPTCGYKPVPCNQDGYRWSKNSCACVPEPATLPRKGANFCDKFLDYTNTKSTAEECNGDAIASNLTDFTDKKADIVLRNGLKLYNVRQNPAPLPLLVGNNQGGSYELADGTTVNVNEFGYTVYLDIDGEKGSSTLWEDVFPFYITMAGKVIPLYHTEGEKEYGGTSRQHLMTSVQKEVITATGHRQVLWIRKSVPFKESACTSGYINSTTPYCSGVSLEPTCNEGANVCILKYVSPVKFF